jgi:hypothetical protein
MKCPDIRQQVTLIKILKLIKDNNGRYNEVEKEIFNYDIPL